MSTAELDAFGLRFRILCGVAADMGMDRDPRIKEIRNFFRDNPHREDEMERRMPTVDQFAAWVDAEAIAILKELKGDPQ